MYFPAAIGDYDMSTNSESQEKATSDRRSGDRRKAQVPYTGPERRKHVRRSGIDRRKEDRSE